MRPEDDHSHANREINRLLWADETTAFSLEKKLLVLDFISWDYFTKGNGKTLASDEVDLVYVQAKYLMVARHLTAQQIVKFGTNRDTNDSLANREKEIELISGVASYQIDEMREKTCKNGHHAWGLEKRSEYLYDRSIKEIN